MNNDQHKFYAALRCFMKEQGASNAEIQRRVAQVTPWMERARRYYLKQHRDRHLKISKQAYVNRMVYSKWARKTGFIKQYKRQQKRKLKNPL